ncbi:MAG TPA: tetratricopeptide repeat protein [Burkholderiales bacterium]|jgi:cytochrome c-type biogenesis protein CcmH/NrfG
MKDRGRGWAARAAALSLALALTACGAVGVQLALSFASPELFAAMFGSHESQTEFHEAAPLIQKKDWLGLTTLARQRLAANPRSGPWWELAAYGHLQLNELKDARDCIERATRLVPEDVEAWNMYANILRRQGETDRARIVVQHALEVDPSSATAYVILGDVQRDGGRARLALQAYSRAIDIDGGNVFAWYGVGLVAKATKNKELYDKAKQNLQQLSKPMAEQLEKA